MQNSRKRLSNYMVTMRITLQIVMYIFIVSTLGIYFYCLVTASFPLVRYGGDTSAPFGTMDIEDVVQQDHEIWSVFWVC